MQRALTLAARGMETTTPNPRVGCVLVRDGQMVGEGWHERAGEPHAEVYALRAAGFAAQGSTAYVTLEPCSHTGRTGPCCEALAAAGVARVVVAMQDPNPLVAGRGIAYLLAAGLTVSVGEQEAAARTLNAGFISRMTRGRPWVRMKVGMSLDGRTALANGRSQWITGPEARADVHRQRARACAVLTGLGTLHADDPELTVRAVATTRQPLRVLVDARLGAAAGSRLFSGGNTVVLTAAPRLSLRFVETLEAQGIRVLGVPVQPGEPHHLDLRAALEALAREQVNEVLVEAGASLNGALLAAGLVDECIFYVAPALLGSGARGLADFGPLTELGDRVRLRFTDVATVGPDLRITAVTDAQ